MQEVQKYLSECIQIFSYEPSCISEGQLAAIARLDLVELETYMDSLQQQQTPPDRHADDAEDDDDDEEEASDD